jgi:hypothetical protein
VVEDRTAVATPVGVEGCHPAAGTRVEVKAFLAAVVAIALAQVVVVGVVVDTINPNSHRSC